MKPGMKILLFIISAMLVLAASSCGESEPDVPPLVIMSEGQTAYQIVRGDNSNPEGAVALRQMIEEKTGVKMPLTTDFEKESSGIVRQDAEITVGYTNRGESAAITESLRTNDYVITIEDSRVHITGGSVTATLAAVEHFCEEFVTSKGISVDGDCDIRHIGSYGYETMTLAGVPIQDYVLITNSNSKENATLLRDAIRAATGYTLSVEDGRYDGDKKAIVFSTCVYGNSAKYAEKGKVNEYGAAVDGGNVYLYKTGTLLSDAGLADWFLGVLKLEADGKTLLDVKEHALTEADLNVTGAAKFDFELATDAIMAEIDKKADALKNKILSSKSTIKPASGCTAYYVSAEGDDANDGKSPEKPWKTLPKVNASAFKAGDVVYFRRGDMFRGNLSVKPGVSYTAYGEGDKPIITASPFNGAVTGKWEETDTKNVYRYSERIVNDVGLLVFNDGESYGIKICSPYDKQNKPVMDIATKIEFTGPADLPGDLFYFHDLGGAVVDAKSADYGYIYLRSDEGNPAERFDSIEFNRRGNVISVSSNHNVTIDNLCVKYGGSHGVGAGTVNGLTVTNCEFAWIGGAIQNYTDGSPVRFGNAVEIYGSCDDYTVQNCYIHDVYDAGVTHQRKGTGVTAPYIMEDVLYDSNLFVNCIYSIEYFNDQPDNDDNIMRNITMTNNICRNAGGFGWQRPNKVARHIQGGWLGGGREYPAENYVVKNNIFDRSIDVLLSVSSTDEKDMPILDGNTYVQDFGKNFGMVGVQYKAYYPYDGTVTTTIRETIGDTNARIIVITDEVKSTYVPDTHVLALYEKMDKE